MMGRTPCKFERIDIDDIDIYPKETLTVWMNKRERNKERDAIQVELRIHEDGTPEIFCDQLKGRSFKNWKPLLAEQKEKK
jgi:hypothetical protein